MILAVKLGLSAAAAGLAWYTKRSIDNSSAEWESRIAYYDYTKDISGSIGNILSSDNDEIVEMKIHFKDAGGSFDMRFSGMIPYKHLVLVIRTNKGEYWGIEKNSKVIHVQRSQKKRNITDMLDGKIRDTTLAYSEVKEAVYLTGWGVNERQSRHFSIDDLLFYIAQKEVSIPYSYLENCQNFLKRIYGFIYFGLPISLSYFDCSSRQTVSEKCMFDSTMYMSPVFEVTFICQVGTESGGQSLVGFVVKMNNAYYSFKQDFNKIYVQRSSSKEELIRQLKGIKSNQFSGVEFPTKSTFTQTSINKRKGIHIMDILSLFRNKGRIRSRNTDLIKTVFKEVYHYDEQDSEGLTFYDYMGGVSLPMIDTWLETRDDVLIADVIMFSKLAGPECGSAITYDNCLTLVLKTSDQQYWSFERARDITYVQKSRIELLLKEKLLGSLRWQQLNRVRIQQTELSNKHISIKCAFKFAMDFEFDVCAKKRDFMESMLRHLGLLK